MKYGHRASPSRRGFTLIEMAMVLVLVSLMTGFALQATQGSGDLDCYAATRTQLATIHKAMDQFVSSNNRYPAPAGSGLGITDPNFGRENVGASISNAGLYFGALPFQALGLPTSYAADCWGNKFTYIVTQTLIDTTNFHDATILGSIGVRSGSSLGTYSTTTPQGSYAVISHGADALGAFKRNYIGSGAHTICNAKQADGAVLRVDKENCDTNNNVIYIAPFSSGNNADYNASFFDDLILYSEKPAGQRCTLPWGGTIASGASVTAYNPNTCIAKSRTCNNGTLGGDTDYISPTPTDCTRWYLGWRQPGVSRDGVSTTWVPSTLAPTTGTNWTSCDISTGYWYPTALGAPGCAHNIASVCASGDYTSGYYPGRDVTALVNSGATTGWGISYANTSWWCPYSPSDPNQDIVIECDASKVPMPCGSQHW